MILFPRKQWNRRPSGLLEIDWSHPLAPGPDDHVVIVQDGRPWDMVSQVDLTLSGSPSISMTSSGEALSFLGVGTHSAQLPGTVHTAQISAHAFIEIDSYAVTTPRIFSKNADAFAFLVGHNNSNYVYDLAFAAVWNTGNVGWNTQPESSPMIPGFKGFVSVIYDGTSGSNDPKLYSNGNRLSTILVDGSRGSTLTSNAGTLYFANRSAGARQFSGSIGYTIIVNRLWPDEAPVELNKNPWQIFKPRKQYFPVSQPAIIYDSHHAHEVDTLTLDYDGAPSTLPYPMRRATDIKTLIRM